MASTAIACVDSIAAASATNSPKRITWRAAGGADCAEFIVVIKSPAARAAEGALLAHRRLRRPGSGAFNRGADDPEPRQWSIRRQQIVYRTHRETDLIIHQRGCGRGIPTARGTLEQLLEPRRVR